jgi:hypothetical protein
MTLSTTTHRRTAHLAVTKLPQPTVDQAARSLMRHFPGWLCWYGTATRAWWTLPPPDCRHPRLIEAATAELLAHRIHEFRAAARRVA